MTSNVESTQIIINSFDSKDNWCPTFEFLIYPYLETWLFIDWKQEANNLIRVCRGSEASTVKFGANSRFCYCKASGDSIFKTGANGPIYECKAKANRAKRDEQM